MGFLKKIRDTLESGENENNAKSPTRDFTYLNDLIRNSSTVDLDCDIVLRPGEESIFKDGIEISRNAVKINGNGHTIDAKGKVRIFNISGYTVELEDIVFKNGFSASNGGAILSLKDVQISNCKFISNRAKQGSALHVQSRFQSRIKNSEFIGNKATLTGTILNLGNVCLKNSRFISNEAKFGGCIFINDNGILKSCGNEFSKSRSENSSCIVNKGKMKSRNDAFLENRNLRGGVILNDSELDLKDATFKNNTTEDNLGSCITNQNKGDVSIVKCHFLNNNSPENMSGPITNTAKISIKDSEFVSNCSVNAGGAINNQGIMTIERTDFKKNNCIEGGGAIANFTRLHLKDCTFHENHVKVKGGAIYTQRGSSTKVSNTEFISNASERGASIYNESKNFFIENCDFCNHKSENEIIYNAFALDLYTSDFKDNDCRFLIKNEENSKLSIYAGRYENNSGEINNIGKSCSVTKAVFKNRPDNIDIYSNTSLDLKAVKFESGSKRVFNEGTVNIREFECENIPKFIKNHGQIEYYDIIEDDDSFNFSRLDNAIRNASRQFEDQYVKVTLNGDLKIIDLKSDVKLVNYEAEFYEGGIEISADNTVINGNGHSIDANGKTRIFNVTGHDITLKNMSFKNGNLINDFDKHTSGGGAIRTVKNSDLKIEKCIFDSNCSDDDAGAILNNGTLSTIECKFMDNESLIYGGAICNNGEFKSLNDEIKGNTSKIAGAIYNGKLADLKNIKSADNASKLSRQIYNCDTIYASEDLHDSIENTGEINPSECEIETFTYLKDKIRKSNEITLDKDISFDPKEDIDLNSGIIINKPLTIDGNGHAIDGKCRSSLFKVSGRTVFRNITFKNAFSNKGHIIENSSNITFEKCIFMNNRSFGKNGLIKNTNTLDINGCRFYNNSSNKHPIICNEGELNIDDSQFINNQAKCPGSVIVNSKKATIKHSRFLLNYTTDNGPIENQENAGEMIITGCEFEKNNTDISAGAIYNKGMLKIDKSKFDENSAKIGGGAIMNETLGKATISDTEFRKNFSMQDGGAIVNMKNMSLDNCKFERNSAKMYGGGINCQWNSKIQISNTNFESNQAGINGGGIANLGKIDLKDSNFKNNSSKNTGGAINMKSGVLNAENSNFTANHSKYGGAVNNHDQIDIKDSKFEKNTADVGSAINNQEDTTLILETCDFSENYSKDGPEISGNENVEMRTSNCRFQNPQ